MPDGVYLIPVPSNLYYSGISSQQGSPTKAPIEPREPEEFPNAKGGGSENLVDSLSDYTVTVPPWQGVKFIRNPNSLFHRGIFRFEILFIKKKYLSGWDQWDSCGHRDSPHSVVNGPDDYNSYYPLVKFTSEIHSVGNHHERIAEYCLQGIDRAEKAHRGPDLFSRVIYVLGRLDEWLNRQDHEPKMAAVDVQLSRDYSLLYHNMKPDRSCQPEGSRLINFTTMELEDSQGILSILNYMNQRGTS